MEYGCYRENILTVSEVMLTLTYSNLMPECPLIVASYSVIPEAERSPGIVRGSGTSITVMRLEVKKSLRIDQIERRG